jgi:hypothetical protein
VFEVVVGWCWVCGPVWLSILLHLIPTSDTDGHVNFGSSVLSCEALVLVTRLASDTITCCCSALMLSSSNGGSLGIRKAPLPQAMLSVHCMPFTTSLTTVRPSPHPPPPNRT